MEGKGDLDLAYVLDVSDIYRGIIFVEVKSGDGNVTDEKLSMYRNFVNNRTFCTFK